MDINTAVLTLTESIARDEEALTIKKLALSVLTETFAPEFAARDEAVKAANEAQVKVEAKEEEIAIAATIIAAKDAELLERRAVINAKEEELSALKEAPVEELVEVSVGK